jgi:hypothetical protein
MATIVTTRYNNLTWQINQQYREKKKLPCVYASPFKMSEKIDLGSAVFVVEMNNSMNEIMGIGLIQNKICNKSCNVQANTDYNRYVYIGHHHISREIVKRYNPDLVRVLDKILFKGYTHSKRGSGFTQIPKKVMTIEMCEDLSILKEIKTIFLQHFRENIVSLQIQRDQREKEVNKQKK